MKTATWIDDQLRHRGIDDERVLDAMRRVPRELFVPPDLRGHAYDDAALPLAYGQTVSQPFIVAYICRGLALRGGERVLDVGTGSGYQAAVLGELAGDVHSVEVIPELAESARAALELAGAGNVEVHEGDGALGLPELGPFAGIAVAAAANEIPPALGAQLEDGGRLALPLGGRRKQELCVFERDGERLRLVSSLPVRFVPLVTGPARSIG
ncbi:MAG TPA: protein-L-isoaspartate(D-aspartate) O-methyltransferase [Gaiellaceae bacterium]|jgi:protein-L-isoaspartate(D-aspartate) O-methyltransferase